MVVQTPARSFCTTTDGVVGGGVIVPLKRTFLLWAKRATVLTSVFTVIEVPTTITGLTTSGRWVSATRNCVLNGTERTANVKLPALSVTILFPMSAKPAYGHGLAWSTTS